VESRCKSLPFRHGVQLTAYQKLRLYVPSDLGYILACKLMAGRAEKDLADIEALCQTLGTRNRAQAQSVVDQYFPSPFIKPPTSCLAHWTGYSGDNPRAILLGLFDVMRLPILVKKASQILRSVVCFS